MRRVLVTVLLFLIPVFAWCQVEHFVYIQTDYKQAFYIRTGDKKIYSSSVNGHLILGKLADSSIQIIVGFPKNAFEEQQFSIPVKKDAGFLLKNFGEEGWGLFNLQTLELIKNSNQPADKKTSQLSGVKKTDRFSTLLANAVNDTAILYTVSVPSPPPAIKNDVDPNSVSLAKKTTVDSASISVVALPKTDSLPPANPVVIAVAPVPEIIKKDASSILQPEKKPLPDTTQTSLAGNKTKKETVPPPVQEKIAVASLPEIIKKETSGSIREENKEKRDTTSLTVNPVKKDTIISPVREKVALANIPEIIKKDTNVIIREAIPPVLESPPKKEFLKETKTDSVPIALSNLKKPLANFSPTAVTKAAEILTDTSYIAVFVDSLTVSYDTIRVSIPFDESKMLRPQVPKTTEENASIKVSEAASLIDSLVKLQENEKPISKQEVAPIKPDSTIKKTTQETSVTKKEESTEIKLGEKGADTTVTSVSLKKDNSPAGNIDTAVSVQKKKLPIPNSDCKMYASENDVDKLRVKMIGQKTDDDKLTVARKIFKQRCFTTRHIKGLSELFVTEDGKYRWLDTAYPFVSDPYNFESAVELLKDEYFINRFKAMIRHAP
jgi:Domain of unknown function (DUF4476)